jgi:hypothetical protein
MRADAIRARSSMAWSRGSWAASVVQTTALGSEQQDERGREAVAWAGGTSGRAFEQR